MTYRDVLALCMCAAIGTALVSGTSLAQGGVYSQSVSESTGVRGANALCLSPVSSFPSIPSCDFVDGVATLSLGAASMTSETSSMVGGPLKARSTISVVNSRADLYTAGASTGFDDVVTFAAASIPAFIRLNLAYEGTISSSDPVCFDYTRPAGEVNRCSYGIFSLANFGADSPSLFGSTFSRSQFTDVNSTGFTNAASGFQDLRVAGEINNINIRFAAITFLSRPLDVAAGDEWSGFATADFFNTAYIRSISYLDADRNDITNQVQATWSSGLTYAAVVPEPSSFLLLVAAPVALMVARGNTRSRRA